MAHLDTWASDLVCLRRNCSSRVFTRPNLQGPLTIFALLVCTLVAICTALQSVLKLASVTEKTPLWLNIWCTCTWWRPRAYAPETAKEAFAKTYRKPLSFKTSHIAQKEQDVGMDVAGRPADHAGFAGIQRSDSR